MSSEEATAFSFGEGGFGLVGLPTAKWVPDGDLLLLASSGLSEFLLLLPKPFLFLIAVPLGVVAGEA